MKSKASFGLEVVSRKFVRKTDIKTLPFYDFCRLFIGTGRHRYMLKSPIWSPNGVEDISLMLSMLARLMVIGGAEGKKSE